ncbi:MAG: hypothetical protein GC131_08600 [Alphaproteobacteria bacterium]|nr:hypothetical protein [Alphaproteobacteria bacterium]
MNGAAPNGREKIFAAIGYGSGAAIVGMGGEITGLFGAAAAATFSPFAIPSLIVFALATTFFTKTVLEFGKLSALDNARRGFFILAGIANMVAYSGPAGAGAALVFWAIACGAEIGKDVGTYWARRNELR